MGEFKYILKTRKQMNESKNELDTLGKTIKERGKRTIKLPYLSDRKTGDMMLKKKRLSKNLSRITKAYKSKRNMFLAKSGGKALLAGAALYGGKRLIDDYDSKYEKYAGYPSRVKDSLSRLLTIGRGSNEIKASSQKAAKLIKRELKKINPNKGELGHLNARKVKESIAAGKKRRLELAGKISAPLALMGSGIYIKKQHDKAHPNRMSNFIR